MGIHQYRVSGVSGKTISSYLDISPHAEKQSNQSPDHSLYLIHDCPTFFYHRENLFRVITNNGQSSNEVMTNLRTAFPPRARLTLHEVPLPLEDLQEQHVRPGDICHQGNLNRI